MWNCRCTISNGCSGGDDRPVRYSLCEDAPEVALIGEAALVVLGLLLLTLRGAGRAVALVTPFVA